MKKCRYCGRENDDTFTQCWECGTELPERAEENKARHQQPPPPRRPIHINLSHDPTEGYRQDSARETLQAAAQLRCRCGGLMNAFYVNETFLMYFIPIGHSMSYRCHLCNHELGIISAGYMVLITLLALMIFGGVFLAAIKNETWPSYGIIFCSVLSSVAAACIYAVYANIRKILRHRKI